MSDDDRAEVARRLRLVLVLLVGGNLAGAVLSFLYFSFIDIEAALGTARLGDTVLYFAASFPVIIALTVVFRRRAVAPLKAWVRGGPADARVRRHAVALPLANALSTLVGWTLAGIAWAVVWPLLFAPMPLARAARQFLGITVVSGAAATVLLFFATERVWRPALLRFFPEGELGPAAGAPRVPVRVRLLGVFGLVGVVPLLLMGVMTYTRAVQLGQAAPAAAPALLHDLAVFIAFVLAVGGATAVGLALFVSRSVAEPLAAVQTAMARVGRGDLEARAPVMSNDELGAVAEGFNRMVAGLRERERIRETFGKYVSPEVRDEILAPGGAGRGLVREVTVLFSDLRDFTPWVEAHPPDEVVRDLNAYFTLMEGAIRAHGGLVLQFIGDEIEAVFGAPGADAEHADHGVAAALEMRRRLQQWNDTRREAGRVALRHGIGVHTGEVLAAPIGSPARLSYALVGDPVNLASRIQDLTKTVGTDVLVSGDTVRRLKAPVALEALPAVRVKGRVAEVEVYRAA